MLDIVAFIVFVVCSAVAVQRHDALFAALFAFNAGLFWKRLFRAVAERLVRT